jgi:hypothetical protein
MGNLWVCVCVLGEEDIFSRIVLVMVSASVGRVSTTAICSPCPSLEWRVSEDSRRGADVKQYILLGFLVWGGSSAATMACQVISK